MAEYTKIENPTMEIPNYSMATAMSLYETDETAIIPMFLENKEEFLSDQDAYHVVERQDENRMDLVSYKYYQTVSYWWIILLANGIYDPFGVRVGDVLRIPSPEIIFTKWLQ